MAGIALSSFIPSNVTGQEATPVAPDEMSSTQCDSRTMGSYGELAQHGTIFMARVIGVVLTRTRREAPLDEIFPKITYTVDVERSLRGDASGRVNVSFLDPRLRHLKRKVRPGPLTAGGRYLFVAGALTSQGSYPVDLEYGFIPIYNVQHAGELIAEFATLVQQAEEDERILRAELGEAAESGPTTSSLGCS